MAVPRTLCPEPWKSRPSGLRFDAIGKLAFSPCVRGYTNPGSALGFAIRVYETPMGIENDRPTTHQRGARNYLAQSRKGWERSRNKFRARQGGTHRKVPPKQSLCLWPAPRTAFLFPKWILFRSCDRPRRTSKPFKGKLRMQAPQYLLLQFVRRRSLAAKNCRESPKSAATGVHAKEKE
jgi:hypothetical protein